MDLHPEKALPILESLVKEQPQSVRALVGLGKALDRTGRYQNAATTFEDATRLDPKRADAHYQLAQVYRKLGREAGFERELALAQKLQAEKREREASLLEATGAHGDPTQALAGTDAPGAPR